MKTRIAAFLALTAFAAPASGNMIAPGETLTGVTVDGKTSIYSVFGRPGNPGGGGSELPAVQVMFGAASGNIFTFTATGIINCCNSTPNTPPDGSGGSMNVAGTNGLSSLSGSRTTPLVGMFANADPFGTTPPGALSFDASNPMSLSPLLNQVFYIGDGRAGFNDTLGALLLFTAPSNATRLFIGTIDASGFNNPSGFYGDNTGAFSVNVSLARTTTNPIPEPATWALMIGGFGLMGAALRRQRQDAKRAILEQRG